MGPAILRPACVSGAGLFAWLDKLLRDVGAVGPMPTLARRWGWSRRSHHAPTGPERNYERPIVRLQIVIPGLAGWPPASFWQCQEEARALIGGVRRGKCRISSTFRPFQLNPLLKAGTDS